MNPFSGDKAGYERDVVSELGLLEYVTFVRVEETLHRRAGLHHIGVPLGVDVATCR